MCIDGVYTKLKLPKAHFVFAYIYISTFVNICIGLHLKYMNTNKKVLEYLPSFVAKHLKIFRTVPMRQL